VEPDLSRHAAADGQGQVAAAMRGDCDAVRDLWEKHRRWVAAILLAHKPREVDLEDLLQDVALTFVRSVGELRAGAALKPWLRTVAINAARASGRKASRRRRDMVDGLPFDPEGPGGPGGGADEAAEVSEEARRLFDLALDLPEGYREPVLLRCVRGMSYRSISELMGLPETTIETRIARGRRMLRERVELEETKEESRRQRILERGVERGVAGRRGDETPGEERFSGATDGPRGESDE
jgi:RNA polymerase sigma factor (sigma-70 family)